MKVKTSELKIGDVLYPVKRTTSSGEEIVSCAIVAEAIKVFNMTLTPVDVFIANFSTEKEDGTFVNEQLKLTDNEEYNVIYRK